MTSKSRQSGMSLLELLVVVAVAGGSVKLTLATGVFLVQKAKDTPTSSIALAHKRGVCSGLCEQVIKDNRALTQKEIDETSDSQQ